MKFNARFCGFVVPFALIGLVLFLWLIDSERDGEATFSTGNAIQEKNLGALPDVTPIPHQGLTVPEKASESPENEVVDGTSDKARNWGSITGRVVDATTQMPITVFSIMQAIRSRTTFATKDRLNANFVPIAHPEGQFELNKVKPGTATVFAVAKGYLLGHVVVAEIDAGETVSDVILELMPGGVKGIVVNAQGEPVAGAFLVEGKAPNWFYTKDLAIAKTDADGTFVVENLSAEARILSADHVDYIPASVKIDPLSAQDIRIVLSEGGSVEGYITENGSPIADANVGISMSLSNDNRQTRTDKSGFYSFSALESGTASIAASIGEQRRRRRLVSAEVGGYAVTKVNIDFPVEAASLHGTIYDWEGDPFQVGVSLRVTTETDSEHYSGKSAADGRYLFDNIISGSATLRVRINDINRVISLDIREGEAVEKDIYLDEGTIVVCILSNLPENTGTKNVCVVAGEHELSGETTIFSALQYFQSIGVAGIVFQEGNICTLLPGLGAGTYTIVGFYMPNKDFYDPRDNAEGSELAYADMLIDSQVVRINEDDEEVQVELIF